MNPKTFKLMIKTHNITGKKYLCITKRQNYEKYTGSGVNWKKHIKKYGNNISTELIYTSDNYEDFLEMCIHYSNYFNIVDSNEYLNMIPEFGYDDTVNNFELYWKYASENEKLNVYNKRAKSIKANHWIHTPNALEIKNKISAAQISFWSSKTPEERITMTNKFRDGLTEFFNDDNRVKQWKTNVKIGKEKYFQTVDHNILSERIRKARLNTSPEIKQRRKEKLQALHSTGKYRYIADKLSNERKGLNNPMSKKYIWYGKAYCKHEFMSLKIPKQIQDKMFNEREDCYKCFIENNQINSKKLICPHCGKENDTSKHPSGFLRWHFNNCKENKIRD